MDEHGDRIDVALIDDQQLVRAGFRMVIDSQPDLSVVVEASDGRQALTELAARRVDVVLMDVQMPRMDGIETTRLLLAAENAPKVVVLTTFDNDEYVISAIRAGASGFLLKDVPPEQLLDGIRTVHRGDAVIEARATRRLLQHVGPLLEDSMDRAQLPEELTPREVEVLEAMAYGLSNTEIAARLHISETTVKTHVGRVLSKTQSRDRVQAVVFAFQVGLVRRSDLLGTED
ncbi:response regulator [Rhodococcus tibetensis]|uniref:Response regulator transcription factor n=1 Tax=Rhodococcus tibetensis TaxID=2965064 RepID=A0ABT1Q6S5_9NOCA|nr:response regulator transcription factor [Rhodococcus sp. FXJ9.536]MCQ4117954.1 response regulator transcription factor [Rhodococcus sp. FXJ9.536]